MEATPDLPFEIAYVLLVDVVGYSKLLVNEQIELLQELNSIVRSTECFRAAEAGGKLIRLPTGDGMALLFSQPGRTGTLCARDQQNFARSSAHPVADGRSQRPGQFSQGCQR